MCRSKKLEQGFNFQISCVLTFQQKNRPFGGSDRQKKSLLGPTF